MLQLLKNWITGLFELIYYKVMNERQRTKLVNIFTPELKAKIKKIITGKKTVQRLHLNKIKQYLYNLGFTEQGLIELEKFYTDAKDPYIKRLAAWELVLWYVNQNSQDGAQQALKYLVPASNKENNMDQLRRIAIIKAECYDILNEREKGKHVISNILKKHKHPDLYLAVANLEDSIEERVVWINKAMEYYRLNPIAFKKNGKGATYDDLKTLSSNIKMDKGPKVSVILPAFNAESGIQTAIESILSQTWQNMELLIIDDCSSDNTVEVVKRYVEKDSRVKLFSTPKNSGPYVARNIGLREASGEFVTINDSDDWSHEQKLEIQVKYLMENKDVMANTSEHARLTEDIKLYRRGTPGKYIFPNMSSIMFRRKPVIEKLGNWDSVRFAADGEFKRRLIKVFGKSSYVNLNSGPLSLPRQSIASLTGSSAFGYNGYFFGARREYVESLEYYHNNAESLFYKYPQEIRPFPVPEPMWTTREKKDRGGRFFDIVFVSDFRMNKSILTNQIMTAAKKMSRIGLVQMSYYDLSLEPEIDEDIRKLIDSDKIQMLVYGEKIKTNNLIVINPMVLEHSQKYIPEIEATNTHVVINHLPEEDGKILFRINNVVTHIKGYFGTTGIWYPANEQIRRTLNAKYNEEISNLHLADEDWNKELDNYSFGNN